VYVNESPIEAVITSVKALSWLLVTQFAIGRAEEAGGSWLDFLSAAAKYCAV